ncbi:MAG: flagellar biosynthesis protein FlhA [Acidimicrobiia bacterium]
MRGKSAILMPLALVAVVLMMVVPMPPALLDSMLALNFMISVLALLAAMMLKDPLELSVFPSFLLVATLTRLALNVSSTRLILLDGYAGKVVDAFGGFVIGGSVIVGLVVFLILVIIQFVVITNGAGRVAEVAARFTLDAIPGKQMAVDADLGSGLINEAQARETRAKISKEADFYGAMDGASKFVKGDAIASIIITTINLIGGLAIGLGTMGMEFGEAVDTFARLSVGDGLVSQIPALLISVATGLLVTRVGSDNALGSDVTRQVFGNPDALRVTALVMMGMGLLPGLPKLPFFGLAILLLFLSTRTLADPDAEIPVPGEPELRVAPDDPEALIERMRVEPLELHLSHEILDLVDPERGGDLMERVRALRRQIADELGVVIPLLRVRDDASLPASTYTILMRGTEVGRGLAPRDQVLALPMGDGSDLRAMGGTSTTEPVFGLEAYWVPDSARTAAAATGATVVDRSSAVVTHLAEVVRSNASRLLSRQDVSMLVDGLRYDEPLLANEVGSDHLPLQTLHAVLRGLLDDRVSIRDISRIVEAVASKAAETRSIEALVTAARVSLGSAIVAKIAPEGRLKVITLDPALEASYHEAIRDVDGTSHLVLDPMRLERLRADTFAALSAVTGEALALVCSLALRRPLQRTLNSLGVDLPVVAYPELPGHLDLIPIGVIEHGEPTHAG